MDNPIRKALEGWGEEGWFQGWYHNEGATAHCLIGRMMHANLGRFGVMPDRWLDPIQTVITEQQGQFMGIAEFNDTPGRTFDEVRVVMEKAAVRWDEVHDLG